MAVTTRSEVRSTTWWPVRRRFVAFASCVRRPLSCRKLSASSVGAAPGAAWALEQNQQDQYVSHRNMGRKRITIGEGSIRGHTGSVYSPRWKGLFPVSRGLGGMQAQTQNASVVPPCPERQPWRARLPAGLAPRGHRYLA